ncbi:exosome complex component RRP40 [Sporothrix brasiliensis 5110]|uniref:Ribosomal RNA-processing protein 40 n=1 Tax=Sporothrix brasiliensis 5110 TaxID=1398154 RepID=A0A0C2IDT2_9PEZI|nr:exosome complex component RRP40 [Sporothrix brasiliensis 5110]KIH87426.1 exosome complex component RRP40 [Sporothrix brasiliensis 5110]
MAAPAHIVLPGDDVDPTELLPPRPAAGTDKKAKSPPPLRLGPGLRLLLPSGQVVPTVSGELVADRRKNLLWVESDGGRYSPTTGDLVIGQVLHTTADNAIVALAPHDAPPLRAVLPVLSFAGATRKNRPDLHAGTLVYARVSLAAKHLDTELECVDPTTGKSEGLGPLVGGMVFPVSLLMARRLLMASAEKAGVAVLAALGEEGLSFETAVGRNGRLWVNSESTRTVVLVGRAITATDAQNLDVQQQRALVKKLVRSSG